MAEDIIDHYIDRNGIKQDTAFLIAELNAVLAKVKEVNDVNRTLGGANTFGLAVKQTKELNTAVTGLSTSYTGLATAARTVAAAQSNSNTTLDGHIERLTRNKSMLADNVKLQKELKKELDAGRISQETYTQKIINTTKRQLEYKNAIANSNAEIKNAAKLAYSVPGSIGQAKAQNIQLRKVADTVPVNEVERLKEINDLIDRNNLLIDANSDKLSRQKINIGNYPTEFKQAFGTLENELEKVNKQIVSGSFSGKEFDGLIAKQSVLQSGVAKLGQEFTTTGAATTAYKNVAKDLGSTFGINSTVFREFNANVGAGSKELNKVNEAVKGAEKSGSKLGGIFQSIGGGAVKLARLLPGIGIAGLIGFAIQPIIDYISNIKKADTVTKLIADDIDKAGSSFQKAATEVYGLKENIKLAKEGFLDKDKVLNEYNTTIGKTIGQVTSLDEAEQEITAKGSAYIQMTLLKAAANIALKKRRKKHLKRQRII